MVLGVGYVSTTGVYETTLRQYKYMPIAEPEFWDMFAQAIVIGHPTLGGGHAPEMITGLHRHSLREEAGKAFWAENPRFSLHTVQEESQAVVGDAAAAKQVPLAEAVAEAGRIWDTINGPNLARNIAPTRARANLVLRKAGDHSVSWVRLRKL